jgi:hypothetical protein
MLEYVSFTPQYGVKHNLLPEALTEIALEGRKRVSGPRVGSKGPPKCPDPQSQ